MIYKYVKILFWIVEILSVIEIYFVSVSRYRVFHYRTTLVLMPSFLLLTYQKREGAIRIYTII